MAGARPEQLPLVWPRERPLARRGDADSSHAAADCAQRSGRLARHRRAVFAVLRAHPGLTSKELAATEAGQETGLDRYEFARRLADLRDHGLAEGPKIEGEPIRWRACDGEAGRGAALDPPASARAGRGGARGREDA